MKKIKKSPSKEMLHQFESFCTAVCFDDRGYKFAYNHSGPMKDRLLNFGPAIIPDLCTYLSSLKEKNYEELTTPQYKPNTEDLEQCCIMLMCDFVQKYKIDVDKHGPFNNIDEWLTWGKDFDPDDSHSYLIS